MKKVFFVFSLLALGYMVYSGVVFSGDEVVLQLSSGIVKSVLNNELVVTEYDYENDEEVENIYSINQSTELKGVNSLNEISFGDNVDVVYSVVDGKNVAQSITVDKPVEDDDPTAGEPSNSANIGT